MAAFVKFNIFPFHLASKVHDFANDQFYVALSNTAPALTDETLADIAEIAAGNGYPAGGVEVPISLVQQTNVARIFATDTPITASGGDVGPFRYAIIYNFTSAGNELVGYSDRGVETTLSDTDAVLLDFDPTTGILLVS